MLFQTFLLDFLSCSDFLVKQPWPWVHIYNINSLVCGTLSVNPTPLYMHVVSDEASVQPEPGAKSKDQYYDDVYFDSDSDHEGTTENKKVCKLTNEELFYDPGMDDRDERWVNRQRMAYHNG